MLDDSIVGKQAVSVHVRGIRGWEDQGQTRIYIYIYIPLVHSRLLDYFCIILAIIALNY